MRIAEFSLATGISTRMLRHHHRRGHLVPAAVDATTGYRTYDPRQVAVARRMAALIRTGMDAPDAAELAADPRPDLLRTHLSRVEDDLRLLRAAGPATRAAVLEWDLAPTHALVRQTTVSVHSVADEVRRAKVELRASTGRGPTTFAPTRRGRDCPPPTAVHVELVDPRWTGDRVTVRVLVPWGATSPSLAGWRVTRLGRRILSAVEVGSLADATLADVLDAHRDLASATDEAHRPDGRLWQLYDATVARMWVAHESIADPR